MIAPRIRPRQIVACVAVLGLVIALAGVLWLRSYKLPAPTGPYAVGTAILDMTDEARHEDHVDDAAARRELVVQVWYPAAASARRFASYERWREATPAMFYAPLLKTDARMDAPVAAGRFPVLIFGHRWNGQRTQNTALAEQLASEGYVVASVDHPYNSARVELADGRVIKGTEDMRGPRGDVATSAEQIAFWDKTLDVWAADDLFVLNQLAAMNASGSGAFRGHLDTDRAGAFGHSFGGAVALRLCGMDPRIKAGVNLDGWTFGALDERTAAEPIMILYEKITEGRRDELARLPQPGTMEDQLDRADFAAVDRSVNAYGGYRFFVADSQHLDFSDQPLLPPLRRTKYTGPIAPRTMDDVLRGLVGGFFDQALRGKPSPLLAAPHAIFAEVSAEAVAVQQAASTDASRQVRR